MLPGTREVGRIKYNLIFVQGILELLAPLFTFFFTDVEPFQIIHAVIHGILWCHFPQRVNITSVELVRESVVSLILEEPVTPAIVRRYHDIATCDHRITWTHAAVLIVHFPARRLDALAPVNLIWPKGRYTFLLQKPLQVF